MSTPGQSGFKARPIVVYDVGGSHISAALCAQDTYALFGLARAPLPVEAATPVHNPAHKFVRLLHALATRAADLAGIPLAEVAGASLAMPGPFDYANGIGLGRHKLQSLYGVDLKAAIAQRFQWQPGQVTFLNDAAAFLLGEGGAGAAVGIPRAIGLTLGTGIGCAYAVDGRIAALTEPGVPPGGEIWNLPYNGETGKEGAGNGATVEDFVSTRFLRKQFLALSGLEAEVSQVAAIAQCQELDQEPCAPLEETLAHQPADSASASVPLKVSPVQARVAGKAAHSAFAEFGRHLGLALNQYAAPFHPGVIVLGGGIARASHLFLSATRETLDFPSVLVLSTLMDQAPLAGAGVHWFGQR